MITARPSRPIHGGISSNFLVPAPQSSFENLTTIDLRAPFKWASKWKKKRKRKAKNERKLESNGKKTFSRLVRWPIQRAKKHEVGLTVIKQRRGAKGLWKDGMMKRFLKSSTITQTSTSLSSSKRDDFKLSFAQTFNPTDEDSSPNYADFSFDSSNQTRIGKWGSWNLDETSVASKKSRGFLKFMSWAPAIQGYVDKKRSQKMSAQVCHDVANDLENLQLEPYKEKANNYTEAKEELARAEDQRKFQSSANTFCDKKEDNKFFGKLSMKSSQNKQLSAPNSDGYIKERASDLHLAHNCEKNTNQEELKSNKDADSTGPQFWKQLIHFGSMSKRNGGLKIGRDEAVKVSSNRSTQSNPRPVDLEKVSSRLSSNDYPFTEIIGSSFLDNRWNAIQSNLSETSSTCTRTGLPMITSTKHEQRSAVTREAGLGYNADLASLNAKLDMRFEQVLTAINIVADRAKRSAESQPQTCIMVDDEEESTHSRLISSCTSDLGTVEMELSPFKNCVSRCQIVDVPIIKEFKEAVNDAHLKIRVLAGLLTVEKDAKMASARDFQSKRMILTMGMMGAEMLEGELLLEKPWHIKYLLDYCVSSIFFNGPHSSSHCICSRGQSFSSYYKSAIFDSFCNDIDFTSMTFDSFCDEATRAVEELTGNKAKGWSDAWTNMFWNCAVCCFHVHKLIGAIRKCKRTVQILHPHHETSFDVSGMDPLDTGNFNAFHKKVLFTIFSGFMLEGKVLCKSQVYLEPKEPAIIL